MGAMLQRRGLQELHDRLDAESYGGAALLGLGGTVVIAHGASTARAVSSACSLAASLTRGNITENVRIRLGVQQDRRGAPLPAPRPLAQPHGPPRLYQRTGLNESQAGRASR